LVQVQEAYGQEISILFLQARTFPQDYLSQPRESKIEEYIREFEQLQMRVSLDEEPELKIVRFLKGLAPSIASKVKLQP